MTTPQNPVGVFLSYAQKDEHLLRKLETHLSMLKRQGLISTWDARQIVPGTNREEAVDKQFEQASVILLLVSADFLASDYCYQFEMQRALERHEASQARVIPIIVRPCDWSHAPFAMLQYLPRDGKAITTWANQDQVWSDVSEGIRQTIQDLCQGNVLARQETESGSKLEPQHLVSRQLSSKTQGEEDYLQATRKTLSSSSRIRYDYYHHIQLPQIPIERPALIADVRAALLNKQSTVALISQTFSRPNALHGMGGIGKTVIARMLCDDAIVQAAFPDGILWATLGQTPHLLSTLRSWIQILGGTVDEYVPTIERLRSILIQLLKDRCCLLILDDVWQHTAAKTFDVGGLGCRLLLTTRDAEIARELRAYIQPIPVMTETEALQLLEEWADGQLKKADIMHTKLIVKRLGYLPLAVKLAGAQLRRVPPETWLQTFDVRQLQSPRPETLHDSLELTFRLSIDVLDSYTRELYIALAIFQEDRAIPQVGVERLWQGMKNIPPSTVTLLLDDLAARALLDVIYVQSSLSRAVAFHDLLRYFIIAELGDQSGQTHRTLVESYRTYRKQRRWHTAEDDGYLYDHIAYHLFYGEVNGELEDLFVDQNWMHTRVAQQNYIYDGYLEDLSFAWKRAADETRKQISADQEPLAFAQCIRYLLIQTSINSISEAYIPALLARAISVNLWPVHRVFSIARHIANPGKKAEVYAALLKTSRLSREQQEETQSLAVKAALTVKDESDRARTLSNTLPPALTEEQLELVLENVASMHNEYYQALVLVRIAPQMLPERRREMLERIVGAVLTHMERTHSGRLFQALVPCLTDEQRERILNTALSPSPLKKRDALHRPRREALEEGKSRTFQTQMLTGLIPHLTDAQRDRILGKVMTPKYEIDQVSVGAALALHMSGSKKTQLLSMIFELLTSSGERDERILKELAPILTDDFLERAFHFALAMTDSLSSKRILKALAPQLTAAQVKHLVMCAQSQSNREAWINVLVALFPVLNDNLRNEVIEQAFQMIKIGGAIHFNKTCEPFLALIPLLPNEYLEQAVHCATAIENVDNMKEALAALAPRLSGELLNQALKVAVFVRDHRTRTGVAIGLATQLRGKVRLEAISQVVEMLLRVPHKDRSWVLDRSFLLEALAPLLPEVLLERVFMWTLTVRDTTERMNMLKILAPLYVSGKPYSLFTLASAEVNSRALATLLGDIATLLPAGWRELAVELAVEEARKDVGWQTALVTLIPHLTGNRRGQCLKEALEGARNEDIGKEYALIDVAPLFEGYQRTRVLTEAARALDPSRHAQESMGNLLRLIPQLTGKKRKQAIEQAYSGIIRVTEYDEHSGGLLLLELSPLLEGKRRIAVLKRARELINTHDETRHRNFAGDARRLIELVGNIEGIERIHLLEQAWHLALEALQRDHPPLNIADLLSDIAPLLPHDSIDMALQTILALEEERDRAYLLSLFASRLTHMQRDRVLEDTWAMKDGISKAIALATLLPFVSNQVSLAQSIQMILTDTLFSLQYASREDTFDYLFTEMLFSTRLFSPETLSSIFLHLVDICEQWHWV